MWKGEERSEWWQGEGNEEWEEEREEFGAEGDGRRGVGKGDGEEILYAYTHCFYNAF